MAMQTSHADGPVHWNSLRRLAGRIGSGACAWLSAAADFLNDAKVQMQIARMQSALHAMSGQDLDRIGVARSDIRQR